MSDITDNGAGAPEGDVSPIKLGDVEYTPQELESLVADGKFKREVETKQNTKLDKVFSEYTKLSQEKNTWEQERDEFLRLKSEKEESNKPKAEFDEATIAQAQAEARKLGLYTEAEVKTFFNNEFPKQYAQQRAADKLLESMEGLEKEINGADGRPAFKLEDVLGHIKETGIKDPLKAYKDKYEKELDTWKEKKLSGSKREGIFSESGSTAGGKSPAPVKVTRDNLGKLVREALTEGSR